MKGDMQTRQSRQNKEKQMDFRTWHFILGIKCAIEVRTETEAVTVTAGSQQRGMQIDTHGERAR